MLGHLTEIAAIDPTTARGTFDEVLGFTLRPIANALTGIFPARNDALGFGIDIETV